MSKPGWASYEITPPVGGVFGIRYPLCPMRLLTVFLAAALLRINFEIWLDEGGVRYTALLQEELEEQQASNEATRARNDRLSAELTDLADGTEVIEEWARQQRGMIRTDEVLVQYAVPTPQASAPSLPR